ncbi:hypothetical protein BDN70DRAFT_925965 [Pholiota conissans]|uniref:NACHT domain-containing protein n=1 Tax=Pholiota conissans TaxID=109636 RepID=A0A9P5YL61_9AGAR|nr:hypothetical protein BDN70DRAFT_925965 [Pholiota conissans]
MEATHPQQLEPPNAGGRVDAAFDLASTVLAIANDTSGFFTNFPYVGAVASVIQQFLTIRDEMRANDARCREIVDKVLARSESICEDLVSIGESNARDKLGKLESRLTAYAGSLKKYQGRSWWKKLANRGLEDLNTKERQLDNFEIEFTRKIIIEIRTEQAELLAELKQSRVTQDQAGSQSNGADHVIPPKPHIMLERDSQLNQALEILLRPEPTRIAIRGGGGFGKTTLARTILHDPKINKRFQVRYFLSCEGMPDADALLLGLGTMLGIKAVPSAMLASILRILQMSTTLLCLDNFETPWEPLENRTKVVELLESIADIPTLSVMITIRGEQRPSTVPWSEPPLDPLSTLSLKGAQEIVVKIAGKDAINQFTIQLLEAIDGIPLAITLVATLLRDGEDSESLWTRWSTDSTQIINVGDDRQSNLDRSISLSVNSSRMTKNPNARLLLAALSLLPDGFPKGDALESLQNCLGVSSIHTILQTLCTVALVQVINPDTSPRIQMLSPIRLFCQHFLAQEIADALPKTVNYYVCILIAAGNNRDNSVNYHKITPEVKNMHTIFQKLFLSEIQKDGLAELVRALNYLTDWSTYIGYYSKDTIQLALTKTQHIPFCHAQCLFSIAKLYYWEADFAHALEHFQEAANLFQQSREVILQAEALEYLGDTLCIMSELDKAEDALKTSLKLYIAENHIHGQEDVHYDLGLIYLGRNQLQDAEIYLTRALELESTYPMAIQSKLKNLPIKHWNLPEKPIMQWGKELLC